jgi:hypothetical protein
MTPSFASRLAFVAVLLVALPGAAQGPPTAGFPVEPAGAGSAQAPAPAPTPATPTSSAAPSVPPAASQVPGPTAAPATSSAVPPPVPPPSSASVTPSAAAHPAAAPPNQPGSLEGFPPPEDAAALPPIYGRPQISFEKSPGWAVELDARGALGVLTGSAARGAFASGGGLLRGHYRYFELGFFYDHADDQSSGGTFSHLGGFAGAWLPYHNWVDFEIAAAFAARRYSDSDPRYGPNGYALTSPALSLMLGVSDRAASGNVGARVGGQLVVTGDLKQHDEPWSLEETNDAGEVVVATGKTHVGGVSISLVFTVGFDVGPAP